MTDEVESTLSRDPGIHPTSRFTASVMERVRADAAHLRPIPFPWAWASPLLAAVVLLPLAVTVGFFHDSAAPFAASVSATLSAAPDPIAQAVTSGAARWLVVALVLSVAPTWWAARAGLSRREA